MKSLALAVVERRTLSSVAVFFSGAASAKGFEEPDFKRIRHRLALKV